MSNKVNKPDNSKKKEPHFSSLYGYTAEDWASKVDIDRKGVQMWEECGYENSWEDLT